MKLSGILSVAQLWAASSAGAEEHAVSLTQLLFPLINFLIFLYLVKRFLMPYVKDHLRSRRADILSAVREADEAKGRAGTMVQDYRKRLTGVDDEAKKIQEELREEGERGRARLLREAEELRSKIKAEADFLADQELKLARQRIRQEIAQGVREAAEKLVRSHLRPEDQRRLVGDFIKELGEAR